MAFVHGKNTKLSVDGDDLSAFSNTSEFGRTADSHDVTTYGKNSYVYRGGLKGGSFNFGGIYDDGATGPGELLRPLVGQEAPVEVIRQVEGLGTGKPTETFDVVITDYTETAPVAGMVTWQCQTTVSDDVVTTAQA